MRTSPPRPAEPERGIDDVPLVKAITERYLTYAVSTIVGRSLPDARDGLKPVHRRLLWAMRQLRLDPASGFKKCARVVGDVIGRYHPHGDVAVYEALVRLAQEFAVRWPLVEGQGNFGNIDGDGPAAMRYTEARLTAVAEALLDGIDEDAVDFRATYDGEDEEPGGAPRRLSEPAGERGLRDRRRHGDQHPAAQRRRNLRRRPASDRASRSERRGPGGAAAGSRFPDRGRAGRGRGFPHRSVPHRPRQLARCAPAGRWRRRRTER